MALLSSGLQSFCFAIKILAERRARGRHFPFEHQRAAGSLKEPDAKALMRREGAHAVYAAQRQFGLKGAAGQARKKPTVFIANSSYVAAALGKRRQGGHGHEVLVNGKAHFAERYPVALRRAIADGPASLAARGRPPVP